ncbi:MAG: hypothetical protein R2741_06935 [Methanolobus sp.]
MFREIPDTNTTCVVEDIQDMQGVLEKFMSGEQIKKLVYIPIVFREKASDLYYCSRI